MKKILLIPVFFFAWLLSHGQEKEKSTEPDSTRMNIGTTEIIFVNHELALDTIDASPTEIEREKNEAHWAGLDLGFNMLLNNQNTTNFGAHDYWQNDPAKSINFNLNLLEHKFSIYKNYVGITTGLGFGFTQIGFKNNYILQSTKDSLFAISDTMVNYSKNKLRAAYFQVPLLLEFCSSADDDKNFYLAAGVVGGVRMTSRTKQIGKEVGSGKEFELINKGTYALNPFKLDAAVRMGYENWGVFASYSLLPVFDTKMTDEIHPFVFGLSYNF
jgi:hypothetical protein